MPTIRAERNQMFLLPPAIEDWVPKDHIARFVVQFIEELPLEQMGFAVEEEMGRPSYSVDVLLGAWIFGILDGKKSSRKIEKMTYDSMAMIWITGNNRPDHNTFWRFFKKNKMQISGLMKETVRLAIHNNMVGFELQAVDGTKIQSDVNKEKTKTIKDMNKKIHELDREIDRIMKEIEENDRQDDEDGKGGYGMPKELQDKENLKKTIKAHIERMKNEGKTSENPADKDSRFMMTRGKGLQQAYNAQAVVDSKKQIIIAEDVTNEASDAHLLNGMIEKAEINTGKEQTVTLADGGYYSPEELAQAQLKSRNIAVNLPQDDGDKPYGKANFKYDNKTDEYVCPKNGRLEYVSERTKESGKQTRIYRCRDHISCPSRFECSKMKSGRIIEATKFEETVLAYRETAKTQNWKELLRKRKTIVEPVFGRVKNILGFTRFSFRGLENVKIQWSFVCAVHNIKTMYALWREGKVKLRTNPG
jgi:transposase